MSIQGNAGITRRKTRQIALGAVAIGGGAPIAVQSMCNTDTRDVQATLAQISRLEQAGCEIVRLAVPDAEAAKALGGIRKGTTVPLIADIHFDYRLALEAVKQGVDGLRINPGNIGGKNKVSEVVKACGERSIPIRIGVNAGSLEKHLLEKFKHPTPEALVESAFGHIGILEDLNYGTIKVSLKASDVMTTVEAYRLFSQKSDYPLHIGISEAGTLFSGTVKSSVGLGILLAEGIGDTMRVSLTADPVQEVRAAWEILKSLKVRQRGINIISCPTCGRTEIDIIGLAEEVERRLLHITEPLTVAVMGCVVNGPGEAREADVGIAGGKGVGLLFKHGEIVKKFDEKELADVLVREVETIIKTKVGSRR
ncbi:MAG: 4-hydroxy-3-methylbut-2-en-1-yl diphosphate synthase [Nitrospirae bacterium GWC2_57_13]|jgi:(E)-4-hydroxy-3-methylbut-2-enyl-diphosphate synthase|nr:MAG: 4-hydroxy-3-methylbut-2-en-1-yl diphosphate synthase [Nitrospirae bacterium GWC1_57_7]OGW29812.1 MAG: 4-hydroxy-3-methylbut-2-en-1-yl diphosphate synthase [Nitrospirae bacterium GWC2_57_13]OGW45587.1 MAG: 4-hydroxy-3-methylbut-2-en-1-yl diphosphate synthase [Nitrospirae bacterium GWD2_57_8]HAR45865.1 4-hydroxy-3-methylbut-2-en-1-yl diphosphate synthase [Nitrospiraceae bacterium]